MIIDATTAQTVIDTYKARLENYNKKWIIPKPPQEIKETPPPFVEVDQIWEDAKAVLHANNFYAVSLCGPQGTGKTTIAQAIMCKAHQEGFKIIYALPEDILSAPAVWVSAATENAPKKVCIVLDDLSYALGTAGNKIQSQIKGIVARIRHLFNEAELLIIYITHRLHAAPPMLRNSGTWIFSNMQSADRDDALEIVGRSQVEKQRLEQAYKFISRVAIEGPRYKVVKYMDPADNQQKTFTWGDKGNRGDGRLMAINHQGTTKIFVSKKDNCEICEDLDHYRIMPKPADEETVKEGV